METEAPPLPARNLCNEGDWALMLPSDGERRLMRVRRGTKFSSGRQQVLMDPLVGAPFGANFRIEASGLVRDPRTVEEIMGSLNGAICAQPDATNAALVDDCTAQTMSEADIRRLKQKGTDGAAVVKAIAAASATFASKTAFSQDKYLRKKAKKHMPFLTLAKPTPLSVCDMYMSKGPDRLLHLRRDSLALVLALSNAQPGSRVLVVESTLGLLTGALAQLIGGEGPLSEVAAQGFTSLVVAVREAPAVAILELLARLVPGSPFVVYHPSITPLAECLHVCQQSRAAVRLQLMETWARKYQVADLRTHPEMNAYPATGYVLSGVAVLR